MPKLFLYALFLSLFLHLGGQAQNTNSSNLLKQLLDLPAPAPRPVLDEFTLTENERGKEFFSIENVPADDAPLEDLVAYWENQNSLRDRLQYRLKPSEKTLERLLEYCEDNPDKFTNLLALMPANPAIAERIKKIYDRLTAEKSENVYLRREMREWLKFNSKYYLDELIKEAQKVRDEEEYVSGNAEEILRSLARVDWDSAKPILDKLLNDASQPYSATLAKWVIYEHALETGDADATERYRSELQKIVENKSATPGQRDLAMDSLVLSGDWSGRDEWYGSLLGDETMLEVQENGYTGLTTMIKMSPPEKWIVPMIKLTKSPNLAVRSAAVRNLMEVIEKDRKDIIEALLPWLSNPEWINSLNPGQRIDLIEALAETFVPEAVPGLIWIVQNEKGKSRGAAAQALVKYKDSGAIPALRFALQDEKYTGVLEHIIEALIACGGIGDDEQMSSLEAFAALSSTPEGAKKIADYETQSYDDDDEKTGGNTRLLPLPVIIGKYISEQEEPGDGLAARAVERLKVLRKTKPAVAQALAAIMQTWKGRVIYMETLRQIRAGEADIDTILTLLANRIDVREKISGDVVSLRVLNGMPRGIGACIAEDAAEFMSILRQPDAETQIAMLACARLIRAALPIDETGALMKSPNKMLALAAERYLEAEDGTQARSLVLAHHPNEALILGARQIFVPADVKSVYSSPALNMLFSSVGSNSFVQPKTPEISKSEEALRVEIKGNTEMLAVYAFLPEAESGQQVVRVYKNRIVYNFYEDEARSWEKELSGEEYEQLYQSLLENKIDNLSVNNGYCESCAAHEFVMFGRSGGRRVFFRSNSSEHPQAIENIRKVFASFRESGLKLHYRLSDKIQGLEVLFAENNLKALAVWKREGDLRVLVEDKVKEEEIKKELAERNEADNDAAIIDGNDEVQWQLRRQNRMSRIKQAENAHYSWRRVENGKLGGIVPQPQDAAYLHVETQIPEVDAMNFAHSWRVRAGNFEIRTGTADDSLYKVSRSQSPVKIKEGSYFYPVVTPDGKWVVASNIESNWNNQPDVVSRINLETGKEFKIDIPPANVFVPIAFVAAHNKMLLLRGKGRFYRFGSLSIYSNEDTRTATTKPNLSPTLPEYYLLDAATGATTLVKGEFRPLEQQTYRPLQPTSNPGEFWAAVYDEKTKTTGIGRYSEKTFSFQPVIKVPDINLNSMNIWVDEKEAKVYFTYTGHLLALPLK